MKLKNFLLLVLLAALWGPSFLFIKVAVADIPPLTMVLGRVSLGALMLYAVLRWQGGNLPPFGPVWKHLAFVGLVQNAIPYVLFGWGEQYIDSALASILNGTTPIFTIILAHFFVVDERLTAAKVAGVVIGMGGLLFLIGPSLAGGLQATTWGLVAATAATFCYGVAIVYARNHLRGLPPLVVPTSQLLMASAYMLPLALFLERPYRLFMSQGPPSWPAIGSVLALALLGTAIAFVVYYRILEVAEASFVSMVTYLVPVFGVILGIVVLDEQLTWNTYAGFALILLGVMIVNGLFQGLRLRERLLTEPQQAP